MNHGGRLVMNRSSGRRTTTLLAGIAATLAVLAPATSLRAQTSPVRTPGEGGAVPAATKGRLSMRERAQSSRSMGKATAPVLVYEIADFQCPYCGRFARNVLPEIDSAYVRTGKVRWVYVALPLPEHPYGWASAEAALCAGAVADRFWAFHDLLFKNQQAWSESKNPTPFFLSYARAAGVPLGPYKDCVANDSVAPVIIEDVIAAASSRVNGTPTFIIDNSEEVVGVKSFAQWQTLLNEELKKKAKASRHD